MPGVLMVEAMAQCGAVAVLSEEANKGKLALFAGIDDVRFKRIVRPGRRAGARLRARADARPGRQGQGARDRRTATSPSAARSPSRSRRCRLLDLERRRKRAPGRHHRHRRPRTRPGDDERTTSSRWSTRRTSGSSSGPASASGGSRATTRLRATSQSRPRGRRSSRPASSRRSSTSSSSPRPRRTCSSPRPRAIVAERARREARGGLRHARGLQRVPVRDLAGVRADRRRAWHNTALVVGSETLSKIVDWTDRGHLHPLRRRRGRRGDRAGRSRAASSASSWASTAATAPTSASRRAARASRRACRRSRRVATGSRMNGREVFRVATRLMVSLGRAAPGRVGRDRRRRRPLRRRTRRTSGSSTTPPSTSASRPRRSSSNIERYGNTSAASIPLGLADALDSGSAPAGDARPHERRRRRAHLGLGVHGLAPNAEAA